MESISPHPRSFLAGQVAPALSRLSGLPASLDLFFFAATSRRLEWRNPVEGIQPHSGRRPPAVRTASVFRDGGRDGLQDGITLLRSCQSLPDSSAEIARNAEKWEDSVSHVGKRLCAVSGAIPHFSSISMHFSAFLFWGMAPRTPHFTGKGRLFLVVFSIAGEGARYYAGFTSGSREHPGGLK